ncbi:hypothetical protein DH2020_008895 [Rehmannia glutinosa]|uniref:Uncharacterized protein n=1 Tax=Rehmannia glutinosa TaxID=99300 RepID=A0ABR0X7Q1_REHGL
MSVYDEQVMCDRWISCRGPRARERKWRGSGPAATPVSGWKFDHRRGSAGGVPAAVSARRLAASLWQLAAITNCSGDVRWQCGLFGDRLGFEVYILTEILLLCRVIPKFCSSSQIPKFEMEGVTKWDKGYSKTSSDVNNFSSHVKKLQQHQAIATISVSSDHRQAEIFKDRKSRKKLKAEHMLTIAKDLIDEIRKERKNCEKMQILNSNLVSDIYETKLLASKYMRDYEKEEKSRKSLENVCVEKTKEFEAKKAEIRDMKIEGARIQEEVEKERKILQITEAWREEHARMKLVEVKLIFEDKYWQMNNIIEDVKAFLRSSNFTTDVTKESKNRSSLKGHTKLFTS